jgi:uncharacterized protein YecE (DUF72 family)
MSPVETSPRVHVGRASLEGNIQRYAKNFDLVEILGERGRHPKRPGLLEWRRVVPPEFVFSVVLPPSVAALRDSNEESLAHAEMVADALEASFWVLRTPPDVMPSPRSTRALAALCERLATRGRRVAWEPRGVWNEESSLATARALRVCLVRDLAKEDRLDDEDVAYTRLRALGEGTRVGAAAAERVAERLEGVTDAYIVVEGEGAGRVRKVVKEMLAAESDDAASDEDTDDSESVRGEEE